MSTTHERSDIHQATPDHTPHRSADDGHATPTDTHDGQGPDKATDETDSHPIPNPRQSTPVRPSQRGVQRITRRRKSDHASEPSGTAVDDLAAGAPPPVTVDEREWIDGFLAGLEARGFFDERKSRDIQAMLD